MRSRDRTGLWVLAIASAASCMTALDTLVVSTALTTIQHDLGAGIDELEWTVNAYNVSFGVLLMTAAALGDRLGRRRMFAAGLALFTIASAACALAPSVGWLIAARAVQGAGAALVMTLAMALVSAAFPPERRGSALGAFFALTGLAVASGPLVGGADRGLDLGGLALAGLGVLGLVWALVRGNAAGWGSAEVLATAAAGALLLV